MMRWLGVAVIALALSACATTERPRGELRYGMATSSEGKLILFPQPPDQPRYAYGGELVGERNFFYDQPQRTFWERVLDALTGIGSRQEALELWRPQAVATDPEGRIYVTDVGRAAVFVFDPVEGRARVLSKADGHIPFRSPTGITVAPGGDVFVADSEAGFVARLGPDGMTRAPIGVGVLKRPTGVVFDQQQQRLLVADTSEHNVKVFDLEGRLLSTIGQLGNGPGEFNRPTHLAIWRNELYVSDTLNARVQVLDLDSGQPIRTVGTRGTYVGQLVRPKGIALDSEGNLYVVESYHDHLLIFDRAGRFLMPIGGTGYNTGSFYLPAGLAIDPGNRIYMADMFNGRIVSYLFLGGEAESED